MKFKFRDDAAAHDVEEAVRTLRGKGIAARRLFPAQSRPSLARIYVIEDPSGGDDQTALKAALGSHARDVEYIEGSVSRKLAG